MNPIKCNSANLRQNALIEISENIQRDGYAILDPDEKSEQEYLRLARLFGPVQWHERSRADGVVDVTSDPSIVTLNAKEFLGNGTGGFEPHSDGAFLDALCQDERGTIRHIAPPAFLLLRCISQPVSGGESLLIDGQKILADMIGQSRELIHTLYSPAFHFIRPPPSKLFPTARPVFSELANQNFMFRFRAGPRIAQAYSDNSSQIVADFQAFCSNYAFNPAYELRFMLSEGHILVVDNFRMLHGRTPFDTGGGQKHRHLTRVWIADHLHRNRLNPRGPLTISGTKMDHVEHSFSFLPSGNPIIKGYSTEDADNGVRPFDALEPGIKLDNGKLQALVSVLENLN